MADKDNKILDYDASLQEVRALLDKIADMTPNDLVNLTSRLDPKLLDGKTAETEASVATLHNKIRSTLLSYKGNEKDPEFTNIIHLSGIVPHEDKDPKKANIFQSLKFRAQKGTLNSALFAATIAPAAPNSDGDTNEGSHVLKMEQAQPAIEVNQAEDAKTKVLTIDELDPSRHVMTMDQLAEKENKNNLKENPAGGIGTNRPKRKPIDPEIEKIKEADIIDYMYNEWLIAFMNWSLKKTLKQADRFVNYLDRRIADSGSTVTSEGSHETTNFTKNIEKLYVKSSKEYQNHPIDNKHHADTIKKLRDGKFEELNGILEDDDIERYKDAYQKDPDKFKKKFTDEKIAKGIERYTDIEECAYRFADAYAAASIIELKANGDKDMVIGKENDIFKAAKLVAYHKFYKFADDLAANKDPDMAKKLGKAVKCANKAVEYAIKGTNKGKYAENQPKGSRESFHRSNYNLNKVNVMLDDAATKAGRDGKKGFYEATYELKASEDKQKFANSLISSTMNLDNKYHTFETEQEYLQTRAGEIIKKRNMEHEPGAERHINTNRPTQTTQQDNNRQTPPINTGGRD